MLKKPTTKKTNRIDKNDYYEQAHSWYCENYESLYCSRNRYRLFSCMLCVLLALSITSVILLLPLKTYIYRIIEVNQQTGELTVLKELEGNTLPVTWVMNRYFIYQYIEQRESYSVEEIKRKFNNVIAMSDKAIADIYITDTVDTNPNSPIKRLNNQYYKEVKVLSINSLNPTTAIARFQTITHNKQEVNEVKREDFQAVIKWKYVNRAESFAARDQNPLGFTVTYYQIAPLFVENVK